MAPCGEQFLKVSWNSVQRSKRSSGLEMGPPYVVMEKSMFCSRKPQNQSDKNLKKEVQYDIM